MSKKIKEKIVQGILLVVATITIPTIVTLIMNGNNIKKRNIQDDKIVIMEYETGEVKLGVEDFLIYVLAAEFEDGDNKEYMKLKCVLYRTMIHNTFGTKSEMSSAYINMNFITENEARTTFGEKYNENIALIRSVIDETKNQKIYYNGKLITPMYHELSTGVTRNGSSINKCFQSAECPEDINAENYIKEFTFSKEEISEKLGTDKIAVVNRCEGDYVTKIRVGDRILTGEIFREILQLPSSSFTVTDEGEGVKIVSKGIGNGYGISMNTAKSKSNAGENYKDIISYFYKNIEIKN